MVWSLEGPVPDVEVLPVVHIQSVSSVSLWCQLHAPCCSNVQLMTSREPERNTLIEIDGYFREMHKSRLTQIRVGEDMYYKSFNERKLGNAE